MAHLAASVGHLGIQVVRRFRNSNGTFENSSDAPIQEFKWCGKSGTQILHLGIQGVCPRRNLNGVRFGDFKWCSSTLRTQVVNRCTNVRISVGHLGTQAGHLGIQ